MSDAPPTSVAASQPSYRDKELHRLMKELRGEVRTIPKAKKALERAEQRLRYTLRVVELWDDSHAKRARELLRLNCIPAANTHATMVFDPELRASLLQLCSVGLDAAADDRMAEALELGREVL